MKKMLSVLFLLACFSPLFSLDDPIFQIHDVPAGPNYTVKDFYVYEYSDAKCEAFARLYYSGPMWREFVKLTAAFFKNGSMISSDYSFIEYETYGSYGMWPGSESLVEFYFDKVDFDSVLFVTSYNSRDGEPKYNKNVLTLISAAIQPPTYGTKSTISGLIMNMSGVPVKFPKVFICVYRSGRMVLFDYDFADAPDYRLDPLQMAAFEAYTDLPAQYDSINYLPNYSVSLTGDILISNAPELTFTAAPKEFTLSQNYPNPFNASTTFRFWIDHPQTVRLEIFDITGKSVMAPFSGAVSVGVHSITINVGDLPSGTYFAVLTGEVQRVTKKMLLVK